MNTKCWYKGFEAAAVLSFGKERRHPKNAGTVLYYLCILLSWQVKILLANWNFLNIEYQILILPSSCPVFQIQTSESNECLMHQLP